nr:cysteine-rich RLK (receptor-like protein kinase) 8 [Tanacetum cinerariifolium]
MKSPSLVVVGEYYTKMKCVWEELDNINVLLVISTITLEILMFLTSLNKKKGRTKDFLILMIVPLSSVENACSLLHHEESQRMLFSSPAGLENKEGDRTGDSHSTGIFKLIHIDIWGPYKVPTNGKFRNITPNEFIRKKKRVYEHLRVLGCFAMVKNPSRTVDKFDPKDYQETFAPVAKMVRVRSLLAISALKGCDTCEMDVSNAFLYGDLMEDVYMKPPLGYVGRGRSTTRGISRVELTLPEPEPEPDKAYQGTLLSIDNSEEDCYHNKHMCIFTADMVNIFESFKIIYQGKTFWVRAKEVPGWSPKFEEQLDEDSEPEDDIFEDKPNTDNSEEEFEAKNVVSDTVFDDGSVKPFVVKNSSGNKDK